MKAVSGFYSVDHASVCRFKKGVYIGTQKRTSEDTTNCGTRFLIQPMIRLNATPKNHVYIIFYQHGGDHNCNLTKGSCPSEHTM